MPLLGQIPISGGLMQGLKQGQDVFNSVEEQRQRQKESEDLAKYHQLQAYLEQQKINQEKEEMPLKYALLREKIRGAKQNGMDDITKATLTKNQSIIENSDNFLDQIDELKKMSHPSRFGGQLVHPDDEAAYQSQILKMADSFLGAQNLPKTDQALKGAIKIVSRHPLESDNAYATRLGNLSKDTHSRRSRAAGIIKNRSMFGGPRENELSEKSNKTRLKYNVETGDFE